MSQEAYDVVVVGGGPAGSAAARRLASKGLSVCVIDRSSFPREKLCGGLVTSRSMKLLNEIFNLAPDPGLFHSSCDVVFQMNGHDLANARSMSPLYFTMRFDFDAQLLTLAKEAGALLKLTTGIKELNHKINTIYLDDETSVAYRFLIGADGVNSQIARFLFGSAFDQNTIGFGLEVEIPLAALPSHANTVEIEFAAAKWGYGWVFPKRTGFTVGIGGIHSQNPDLRERLASFLLSRNLYIRDYRVKGQYIPFGDFRKEPGRDNILLCGDAAGLVDPITGEGIAYALQSGAAAADAIYRDIETQGRENAYGIYYREHKKLTRSISQADLWRNLIFPDKIQRIFAWALSDASTLQQAFLQILAGDREYNSLPSVFLLQAGKACRKLALKIARPLLSRR